VRISVTIPKELLTAVDRKARELDRPRSWVIAEAARRFLEAAGSSAKKPAAAVRENSPAFAAPDIAAARRRHLQVEASLPPEERLRRAEELTRLARLAQHRPPRQQIIGFD